MHVPLAKPLPLEFFARDPLRVARDLLGCRLSHGGVTVRLTEVEAYAGAADPGSHAFLGRSPRNDVMFGPAGRLYVYFTYGMHFCANIVTGVEGEASAVLLRAGEVVDGHEVAGACVRECEGRGIELWDLSDDDLARVSPHLTPGVRDVLSVEGSLASRSAKGGTAPVRVGEQLTRVGATASDHRVWSRVLPTVR